MDFFSPAQHDSHRRGIILMRIGFSLFLPSSSDKMFHGAGRDSNQQDEGIAFVPLAMPLMFGPGVLATILGMSSLVRHPISNFVSLISVENSWLTFPHLIWFSTADQRLVIS